MSYLISIEEGFTLFRKSIKENNSKQYSIWVNTISRVFDYILTTNYKKGNKTFEELRNELFNFLIKYKALDLFVSEKLYLFIRSRLEDFQCSEILNSLKYVQG